MSFECLKPIRLAIYIVRVQGAVAQLGERDVRNVEVRGSIPLSSNWIRLYIS